MISLWLPSDVLSLSGLTPQLALLVLALGVALADLWVTDPQRKLTYWLTQSSIGLVAWMHWSLFDSGASSYSMSNMLVSDPLGHLLGLFASIALMIALVYARAYAATHDILKGELFSLTLFSLLGIFIILSANNFLVAYMGLELMSLSLYALVALRRDHLHATEAAMKYFVLGALASGFLLYGMSMIYGATGSLFIPESLAAFTAAQTDNPVFVLGLVFVVAGLAFKLGAVPFHMWVPDVYHGSPTGVTLLLASAPKLAAFALTFRLLVEGLATSAADWQQMLIVLAVASMLIGNLAAIAQSNIKRMLAYSTIGQVGFMLLGFVPDADPSGIGAGLGGYSSAMFYVTSYVLTTLCTFGVVILLSRQGFEADKLSDFQGLARRSPWFAAIMALCMFSLAGIPPTVGFAAKLSVLQALIATGESFYIGLAVAALVLSLIAAFYYIRVVKFMFFDEPLDGLHPTAASGGMGLVLSLNGMAVLALGVVPGGLMAWCMQAVQAALNS